MFTLNASRKHERTFLLPCAFACWFVQPRLWSLREGPSESECKTGVEALDEAAILYERPSMSFHVNLGEGRFGDRNALDGTWGLRGARQGLWHLRRFWSTPLGLPH